MELPLKEEYMDPLDYSFVVSAVNDHIDTAAGTRKLTLKVTHPGIIWTAVAFDANVLKWDLDENPPDEYARHHIKEGSFYGHDTWTVDLLVKLAPDAPADGKIRIDFVGIHEKAMWPGKRAEKHLGGHAMKLFEELDGWLDETTGGTVDATLLGCVGGVAWV